MKCTLYIYQSIEKLIKVIIIFGALISLYYEDRSVQIFDSKKITVFSLFIAKYCCNKTKLNCN